MTIAETDKDTHFEVTVGPPPPSLGRRPSKVSEENFLEPLHKPELKQDPTQTMVLPQVEDDGTIGEQQVSSDQISENPQQLTEPEESEVFVKTKLTIEVNTYQTTFKNDDAEKFIAQLIESLQNAEKDFFYQIATIYNTKKSKKKDTRIDIWQSEDCWVTMCLQDETLLITAKEIADNPSLLSHLRNQVGKTATIMRTTINGGHAVSLDIIFGEYNSEYRTITYDNANNITFRISTRKEIEEEVLKREQKLLQDQEEARIEESIINELKEQLKDTVHEKEINLQLLQFLENKITSQNVKDATEVFIQQLFNNWADCYSSALFATIRTLISSDSVGMDKIKQDIGLVISSIEKQKDEQLLNFLCLIGQKEYNISQQLIDKLKQQFLTALLSAVQRRVQAELLAQYTKEKDQILASWDPRQDLVKDILAAHPIPLIKRTVENTERKEFIRSVLNRKKTTEIDVLVANQKEINQQIPNLPDYKALTDGLGITNDAFFTDPKNIEQLISLQQAMSVSQEAYSTLVQELVDVFNTLNSSNIITKQQFHLYVSKQYGVRTSGMIVSDKADVFFQTFSKLLNNKIHQLRIINQSLQDFVVSDSVTETGKNKVEEVKKELNDLSNRLKQLESSGKLYSLYYAQQRTASDLQNFYVTWYQFHNPSKQGIDQNQFQKFMNDKITHMQQFEQVVQRIEDVFTALYKPDKSDKRIPSPMEYIQQLLQKREALRTQLHTYRESIIQDMNQYGFSIQIPLTNE